MNDLKAVQQEASRLEIEVYHVAEKTRDGAALFDLLREGVSEEKKELKVKTLEEFKEEYVQFQALIQTREQSEASWSEITEKLCPVEITSSSPSQATLSYFDALDKHWDLIRRTPAVDVANSYIAPVDLSSYLRPYLNGGSRFVFSFTPKQSITFNLGESFPPRPPLPDEVVNKRLRKLVKRMDGLYRGACVDFDTLRSFVDQMNENEAVINSFSNCADFAKQPDKFSVRQLRMVNEREQKHREWTEREEYLLRWQASSDDEVELVQLSVMFRL